MPAFSLPRRSKRSEGFSKQEKRLPLVQLEFTLRCSVPARTPGPDPGLETLARQLFRENGAQNLAARVVVEWSARLRSAAGRAEYAKRSVLLNCRLSDYGEAEIDRTLRHELAHLLAQFRAGRRHIAPHGAEWRRACADLGIANEMRCHNLPLPVHRQRRRYLYVCADCGRELPRSRPLRRACACLACCRAFNHGRYHERFRLKLVSREATPPRA